MDSLTHIVLGATMGQAMAGRKLNRHAMVWGAVAQSLPDLDFVASFWTDTATDLLVHRGITHSVFFALLFAPLIALVIQRWYAQSGMTFADWTIFWLAGLLMHLFIDVFNAYGTALLAPFDDTRYALNVLFVADPLFTVWPILATALCLIRWEKRKRWAAMGLSLSGLYLCVAIGIKWHMKSAAEKSLAVADSAVANFFITPSPMNTLLWYAVAKEETGFRVAYRSVFDDPSTPWEWQWIPKNDSLLDSLRQRPDAVKLIRFSQGYYAISHASGELIFNDLRFGQRGGWNHDKAGFVFQYFLLHPDNNKVIIQRGRVGFWTRENLKSFLKRIKGG